MLQQRKGKRESMWNICMKRDSFVPCDSDGPAPEGYTLSCLSFQTQLGESEASSA